MSTPAESTPAIAVVADKLWRSNQTGIGRVIEGLSNGLADRGARAIVIGFRDRQSISDQRYGLPAYEIPISRRRISMMRFFGLSPHIESLIGAKISVIHNSNIASPVRSRLPTVVSVYDLSPIDLPTEYRAHIRATFRDSIRASEDGGHIALCLSKYTAARLVDAFPGFEGRVVIGPPGPSLVTRPKLISVEPPRRILFVGEITRRKRPDLVVKAFEQADLPAGWRLTIVGNPGNAHQLLMRLVEESPLRGRIDVCLSASDEQLVRWYANSAFLVLPSELEGFGMPVLDAIAAGLPVVVTEGSSLPEVAGPGGLVISRGNVRELARAMGTLALDPDARRQLSAAATKHAERFSWHAHTQSAIDAYQRAISASLA